MLRQGGMRFGENWRADRRCSRAQGCLHKSAMDSALGTTWWMRPFRRSRKTSTRLSRRSSGADHGCARSASAGTDQRGGQGDFPGADLCTRRGTPTDLCCDAEVTFDIDAFHFTMLAAHGYLIVSTLDKSTGKAVSRASFRWLLEELHFLRTCVLVRAVRA